jgi:hypothetical protein
LAKAEADPATRVDSVVVKSRGGGAHVELPRIAAPSQSKSREISAASEVGRKCDGKDEAGKVEARREELNKRENRTKPRELGREIDEGTTAIDTRDARVTV